MADITYRTAQDAIARSVSHTEIVTLPYDEAVAGQLAVLADDSVEADGTHEYWGTDEDGHEWRVHLREDEVRCACGAVTGVACEWAGPRAETVILEWMPEHLRASHEAAGNRGAYPHNGAERLRVERSCAEAIVEADGEWAEIVAERRRG